MSRIKYPEQRVIDQQIAQILDKSGLFGKSMDDNMELDFSSRFVRCEPVKEKKSVTGLKVMSGIVAVAAVILMAVAIGNYAPVQRSGSQPLNAVPEDTTVVESNKKAENIFRNQDISVTYEGDASELQSYGSASQVGDIQYSIGSAFLTMANVMYKGTDISLVDKSRFNIKNKVSELYNQYYAGGKSGIEVNYVETAEDAGLSNDELIVLKCNTQIELNDIENPITYNSQTGFNVDVSTRNKLTFDKIFKDVEAGKTQLRECLAKEISSDNKELTASEIENITNEAVADEEWYLKGDNINIIVNGYQSVKSETRTLDNFKVFSIPMSDLTFLYDDYRENIYYNRD